MAQIDVTHSEIRTVVLNEEGREGKPYKLIEKVPMYSVANTTLTYTLSHGGYRIRYSTELPGTAGCCHDQPGAG